VSVSLFFEQETIIHRSRLSNGFFSEITDIFLLKLWSYVSEMHMARAIRASDIFPVNSLFINSFFIGKQACLPDFSTNYTPAFPAHIFLFTVVNTSVFYNFFE